MNNSHYQKRSIFPIILVIILGLLISLPAHSVDLKKPFDHSHSLFDSVLQSHVSEGLVNYAELKKDHSKLDQYLKTLAIVDPNSYKNWTRQQKITLWINAYNAFTIKGILKHYPIEPSWIADPLGQYPHNSIRQIKGIWDDQTWLLMGKQRTLNYMEHEILRKVLFEPQVHFVLVCASKGCPLLENRSFDAESIERRLDQAAKNYIYRDRKIHIDKEKKVVRLPQIFKWFPEDFKAKPEHAKLFKQQPENLRGILSWLYRNARKEDRQFLASSAYKVSYLYYDWGLNEISDSGGK